jgi:hypothetical protein
MTDDNRALKVFLCHAHSDKDAVKALYARLKREGVDCCAWLDKEKPCGERSRTHPPRRGLGIGNPQGSARRNGLRLISVV